MLIRTRIFELCDGNRRNLSDLVGITGLSISKVHRVCEGKHFINQKFIGAKKAFPDYHLDELLYLDSEFGQVDKVEALVTGRYPHIVVKIIILIYRKCELRRRYLVLRFFRLDLLQFIHTFQMVNVQGPV